MQHLLFLTLLCILSTTGFSQGNIHRQWKTIDDETGKAKSVVSIYERDGKTYGKIIKLFREEGEDPDPLCTKCPEDDSRYNEKIIGMEIIKDLEKDDDEYAGGTVLKPDEGTIYKCRIWREGNTLKVRGYWGFLYRTQTWEPYDK